MFDALTFDEPNENERRLKTQKALANFQDACVAKVETCMMQNLRCQECEGRKRRGEIWARKPSQLVQALHQWKGGRAEEERHVVEIPPTRRENVGIVGGERKSDTG